MTNERPLSEYPGALVAGAARSGALALVALAAGVFASCGDGADSGSAPAPGAPPSPSHEISEQVPGGEQHAAPSAGYDGVLAQFPARGRAGVEAARDAQKPAFLLFAASW